MSLNVFTGHCSCSCFKEPDISTYIHVLFHFLNYFSAFLSNTKLAHHLFLQSVDPFKARLISQSFFFIFVFFLFTASNIYKSNFPLCSCSAAGPSATTTGSSTPSLTWTGSTEQPEGAASGTSICESERRQYDFNQPVLCGSFSNQNYDVNVMLCQTCLLFLNSLWTPRVHVELLSVYLFISRLLLHDTCNSSIRKSE